MAAAVTASDLEQFLGVNTFAPRFGKQQLLATLEKLTPLQIVCRAGALLNILSSTITNNYQKFCNPSTNPSRLPDITGIAMVIGASLVSWLRSSHVEEKTLVQRFLMIQAGMIAWLFPVSGSTSRENKDVWGLVSTFSVVLAL